jgi:hypothetical protein
MDFLSTVHQWAGSPGELGLLLAILWRIGALELKHLGLTKRVELVEAEAHATAGKVANVTRLRERP